MNSGTKIGMFSKIKNIFRNKKQLVNIVIVKEKEVPTKIDFTKTGMSLSKQNSMLYKSDYDKRLAKNQNNQKKRIRAQWNKDRLQCL